MTAADELRQALIAYVAARTFVSSTPETLRIPGYKVTLRIEEDLEGTPDLAEVVRRTLVDLDARGRYGGLVPIPVLRDSVCRELGITRAACDAGLLALKRQRSIDMKITSDRRSVQRPEEGIEQQGRGLLYWVVAR